MQDILHLHASYLESSARCFKSRRAASKRRSRGAARDVADLSLAASSNNKGKARQGKARQGKTRQERARLATYFVQKRSYSKPNLSLIYRFSRGTTKKLTYAQKVSGDRKLPVT